MNLTISHKQNDYMVAADTSNRQDVDVEQHKLKNCANFVYIGIIL